MKRRLNILEKERKYKGKRVLVLIMAMVLCLGTCVSVFAATKTGQVLGMTYTFEGSYKSQRLYGSTEATIYSNKYSYVKVEFMKNMETKTQDETYGDDGNYVELTYKIGKDSSNWRIRNSAFSKKSLNSGSVHNGSFTFY